MKQKKRYTTSLCQMIAHAMKTPRPLLLMLLLLLLTLGGCGNKGLLHLPEPEKPAD